MDNIYNDAINSQSRSSSTQAPITATTNAATADLTRNKLTKKSNKTVRRHRGRVRLRRAT
jgi:hypothetical protein